LDVYSINYPDGFSDEWFNGIIPPAGIEEIEVTFTPTEIKLYNGLVEVDCNSVSGTRTLEIFGEGTDPNTIKDEKNNELISLFPNPSSDKIQLSFKNNNLQIAEFQIYDRTGRKMMAETEINKEIVEINIEKLISGIYYCRIVDNYKNEYITKFEVMR
jgi:hypothetical protein